MIARRVFPASHIADIHRLVGANFPMLDNTVPTLIELGVYQVKGENGEILSVKQSLELLEVKKHEKFRRCQPGDDNNHEARPDW